VDRFFELLPLAALCWIGAVGLGRAAIMYRRGVQVVAIDRERTLGEQAFDLTVVLAVALWAYLVVDYTWPPSAAWLPNALKFQIALPTAIKVFGAALLCAGMAIYAVAVVQMGASWRLGIDRAGRPRPVKETSPLMDRREEACTTSEQQTSTVEGETAAPLVTAGIFAWSRNPIYLAFDLTVDGAFAVHGHASLLLLALLLTTLLHFQVLREERFLAGMYGETYAEYKQCVGQYGPWNRWFG